MVVQNKCNMTIVSTHDKNNVRWFTLSAICTEMGKDLLVPGSKLFVVERVKFFVGSSGTPKVTVYGALHDTLYNTSCPI